MINTFVEALATSKTEISRDRVDKNVNASCDQKQGRYKLLETTWW